MDNWLCSGALVGCQRMLGPHTVGNVNPCNVTKANFSN